MSQQINLLLPELRPRRDWLALPTVAAAALAGLLLMAGAAAWGRYQAEALAVAQARSQAELANLQQQVQGMAQVLASRQGNPALHAEIAALKETLQQQDAVLAAVESGKSRPGAGYASLMRGFARQTMEGVWLTGFSFSGTSAEIHGRLSDPDLLPRYIRRLNGEPAFQGRRFAALDMKESAASGGGQGRSGPRYTDFILRGSLVAGEGAKP